MDISCRNQFKRHFELNQYKTSDYREEALVKNRSYFDLTTESFNKIEKAFQESLLLLDRQNVINQYRETYVNGPTRTYSTWEGVMNRMVSTENAGVDDTGFNGPRDQDHLLRLLEHIRGDTIQMLAIWRMHTATMQITGTIIVTAIIVLMVLMTMNIVRKMIAI